MNVRKNIYCGSNECNNDNIPSGYDSCGTRNQCMKRGVGIGIYSMSPEERKFKRDNATELDEDRDKVYCGDKDCDENNIPDGYDMCGTPHTCMKKGVGVGVYAIDDEVYEQKMEEKKNQKIRQLNLTELQKIAYRLGIDISGKNRGVLLNRIVDRLEEFQKIL